MTEQELDKNDESLIQAIEMCLDNRIKITVKQYQDYLEAIERRTKKEGG